MIHKRLEQINSYKELCLQTVFFYYYPHVFSFVRSSKFAVNSKYWPPTDVELCLSGNVFSALL